MKNTSLPISEMQECIWLVGYLDTLMALRKVTIYTHIANETYTTSWSAKIKNKRMGLVRGLSDYIIVLHNPKRILFIEMKRARGGAITPEQKVWIDTFNLFNDSNVYAKVCHGFTEAKAFIDEQLHQ